MQLEVSTEIQQIPVYIKALEILSPNINEPSDEEVKKHSKLKNNKLSHEIEVGLLKIAKPVHEFEKNVFQFPEGRLH